MGKAFTGCAAAFRLALIWGPFLAAALSPVPAKALWNGNQNAARQASFTALLAIKGDKQLDCTGVLIAPRLVLTAGHCLHNARAVSVTFPKGARSETISAEDWIVHPSWNAGLPVNGWDARINAGNGDNYIDLAVLRLRDAPAGARPIDFAMAGASAHDSLRTYGYARSALLEPLHRIDASSATYLHRLSSNGPLKVYASGGAAWCQGDSGGPVTNNEGGRETLVGIVGLGLGAIDYDPASALSMRWGGTGRVPKCGAYAYVQDISLHSSWISQAGARLSDEEAITASLPEEERDTGRN